MAKERRLSLDLVRVVAIFLVLLVHTRSFFINPQTSALALATTQMLGNLGVPLFVILSGYLMVDRPYDSPEYRKKFFKRNLLPLFVAFECWNFLWFVFSNIPAISYPGGGFPVDAHRMIKTALFIGDTGSALWYLPMMLALYLGLPIVSMVIKKFDSKGERTGYGILLMVLIAIFGTAIPSLQLGVQMAGMSTQINPVLSMNIFSANVWGNSVWVLYLVMGYFLKRGVLKNVPTWAVAVLLTLLPIVLGIGLDWHQLITGGTTLESGYSFVLVVIAGIGLFELLDRTNGALDKIKGGVLAKITTSVSRTSFATYMIHLFVIGFGLNVLHQYTQTIYMSELMPVPECIALLIVADIVVLAICAIIAELVSKIKPVGRWLLLMK